MTALARANDFPTYPTAPNSRSRKKLFRPAWTLPSLWLFIAALASLHTRAAAGPQLIELAAFAAEPTDLTPLLIKGQTRLYFSGGTSINKEPWVTNGTKLGTKVLKEVNPSSTLGSNPKNFVYAGGLMDGGWVLFCADDGATGEELWVHKLQYDVVERFDDLMPGAAGSVPRYLRVVGFDPWGTESVFLAADRSPFGNELIRVSRQSRTSTDVVLGVEDIRPSSEGSFPRDLTFGYHYYEATGYAGEYLGAVFFSADDGTRGREFARWDWGHRSVTKKDFWPGSSSSNPDQFTRVNYQMYFTANNGTHGRELWLDDGKESTAMVKDIEPGGTGSNPLNLTPSGATLFFTALTEAHSRELWKSNGTAAGTVLVKDIYPGANGSGVNKLCSISSGRVLFSATNGSNGHELWKSDGTDAGTVLVKDINPGAGSSNIREPVAMGNKCYFTANDGQHGQELWVSDGTAAGTKILFDLVKGPGSSNPRQLASKGDRLFFTVANSLYMFNPEGTPPPNAPSNLQVNLSQSNIDCLFLQWMDNSSDEDGFYLWCNAGNVLPTTLAETAGPDYRGTYASGLIPNTLYSLTVTAYSNEGGESLLPVPFYITEWTLARPPLAGTNLTASRPPNSWSNNVSLTFSNPQTFGTNNRVSGYQWVWNTSPSQGFTGSEPVWSAGNLSRTASAQGSYYLHVRSLNGGNVPNGQALHYGPFHFDFQAPAAPAAPVGMVPAIPDVRFDWEPATDTGGSEVAFYECQIGTTAGGNDVFSGNVGTSLTKTVAGASGNTYYARVRAIDGAGNVGPWSPNSAGTPYSSDVGLLTTTISPPLAVISGAQWRRVGTTTWRSGTEANVPVGVQTVEFKELSNWLKPSNKLVTVLAGTTATASGTYAQSGRLQVVISPPAAVAAGAQWRHSVLSNPSKWFNSGETINVAAGGLYVIQFKDIPSWGRPLDKGPVSVTQGNTTVISGPDATYSQGAGSLIVILSPPEAVTAGAQWRRTGTSTWRNSNTVETDVPAGGHAVEFKAVTNWTTPANYSVTIAADQRTTVSGPYATYTRHRGALVVTLLPPDVELAGAQWRRVGTTTWRSSGITETNIPVGNYTVEMKAPDYWRRPANRNVTISNNQTTSLTVNFGGPSAVPPATWTRY